MSGSRDNRIDVIKGVGIILMVLAHTNSPFDHFICLFHMPIFFIASGYFWNNKHSDSFDKLKSYSLKKIKTIWLPYAITNGVFTLLHNIFIKLNIYTDDPLFLDLVSGRHERLTTMMTPKETIIKLIKNIFFMGQTQLGAATWFLRTLFIVVVFHAFLCWVIKNIKWKKYIYIFVIIVTAVLAQLTAMEKLNFVGETVKSVFLNVFSAYLTYWIGILFGYLDRKKEKYSIRKLTDSFPILSIIGSLAVLLVMNPITDIIMKDGLVTNILFMVICSVAGWCFLMGITSVFSEVINRVLEYLGRKTMPILELHFLCFKIVSLLIIVASGRNIVTLASFPILEDIPKAFSLLYLLAGLSIPVIYSYLFEKAKKILKQRINIE